MKLAILVSTSRLSFLAVLDGRGLLIDSTIISEYPQIHSPFGSVRRVEVHYLAVTCFPCTAKQTPFQALSLRVGAVYVVKMCFPGNDKQFTLSRSLFEVNIFLSFCPQIRS